MRTQVARLRTLVEDLLEIARLDAQTDQVELRPMMLSDLAPGAEVVRDGRVLVDPRRVERVLTNLLSNAEKHGREPIQLFVDAPRLLVRDGGDGFPQFLLGSGPRRFRRESGEQGSGLGLAIAQRQAHALGGELTFSNHAAGGAQAELLLRSAES